MDSEVTLNQLQDFHTIDRQAYASLVIRFGFDPNMSKKIIAFWNFLETCGSGCKNFVKRTQVLPDPLFFTLVHESTKCLNFLAPFVPDLLDLLDDPVNDLPFMRVFAGNKISARFVYENREFAMDKIQSFMKNVCERAFLDIIPVNVVMSDYPVPNSFNGGFVIRPDLIYRKNCGFDHHDSVMKGCDYSGDLDFYDVPESERTLFVTFSRGHPVPKKKLKAFFNRNFGNDFVELIRMKQNKPVLYARVIVKSLSCVAKVLGGNEVVQFSVGGKDIRVRHFVHKHA